jgi:Zn-dependent protease
MFITPREIFDIIVMTLVVGFVFMKIFKPQSKSVPKTDDALEKYLKKKSGFDWHAFWFAAMVTAPAIILHELGHKITALSFGLSAEFHAAYLWLGIAIVLRLIGSSFIFFVPAFVSISTNAALLPQAFIQLIGPQAMQVAQVLIAFAGPGVNLIIFLVALIILKTKKGLNSKATHFWSLTKSINLFLFAFNMIPIPGFDGFHIFSGIWKIIGL